MLAHRNIITLLAHNSKRKQKIEKQAGVSLMEIELKRRKL